MIFNYDYMQTHNMPILRFENLVCIHQLHILNHIIRIVLFN